MLCTSKSLSKLREAARPPSDRHAERASGHQPKTIAVVFADDDKNCRELRRAPSRIRKSQPRDQQVFVHLNNLQQEVQSNKSLVKRLL